MELSVRKTKTSLTDIVCAFSNLVNELYRFEVVQCGRSRGSLRGSKELHDLLLVKDPIWTASHVVTALAYEGAGVLGARHQVGLLLCWQAGLCLDGVEGDGLMRARCVH